MLMRMWRTRISEQREDEYIAFAESHSRRMFRSQPGCLGVLFLKSGAERVACSFWNSYADLSALAGSPSYRHTSAALQAKGLLIGPAEVTVYEVEGGACSIAWLDEAVEG